MDCDIEKFVGLFVQKRWRDRFTHEFRKKPHDLMHRCIINWQQVFSESVLQDHKPNGFNEEIVNVIDWGDVIEEWRWVEFLDSYPKTNFGFIAIARSGNFGFLETHESHPKDSKHYYIFKT